MSRIRLIDLQDLHKGSPAAVLGGGPSLHGDVERLPSNCLLLAVNHHAAWIGIETPYLVFMDDPAHQPLLFQCLKDYSETKVSQLLAYSDVDMRGVDYWNGPGSGIVACWLACYFGCDPVLLCGMDLYQGETKYCHRGEPEKPIYAISLDEHLRRWKAGFRRCRGIEHVRAMSGPLVDVFGSWPG